MANAKKRPDQRHGHHQDQKKEETKKAMITIDKGNEQKKKQGREEPEKEQGLRGEAPEQDVPALHGMKFARKGVFSLRSKKYKKQQQQFCKCHA